MPESAATFKSVFFDSCSVGEAVDPPMWLPGGGGLTKQTERSRLGFSWLWNGWQSCWWAFCCCEGATEERGPHLSRLLTSQVLEPEAVVLALW